MLARWLLLIAFAIAPLWAVPRPDAKATLRQLTRLPRIELRLSLDFSAADGFPALNTAPDPAVTIGKKRAELAAKPNDPQLLLDLAALHNETGEFGTAHTYFRRAEQAARSSELRLIQASALHGLARHAEAESVFREAVAAANDAQSFLAFAAFLDARGWEMVSGISNWNGRRSYAELARGAIRQTLPAETLARAERLLQDGIDAAQKAVALKPDLATARHRLGVCVASKECFERARKKISGNDQSSPAETLIYSSAAVEHFEKALELNPENSRRVATLALWRSLAAAAEHRPSMREFTTNAGIDFAAESDRVKIEDALNRLGELTDSAAAQAHGTLLLVLKADPRRAAEALTAALERNSESEQLWETLTIALNRARNYAELAVICEARGIERPTVRNRLLIAKAYEKLGDFDRAEEEVRLALAMNAGDFSANLALANIIMRNATDMTTLPRARQALTSAERALGLNARSSQWLDLALTQSIYHGLSGNPDTARQILNAAAALAKDDPEVSAALDAIGR